MNFGLRFLRFFVFSFFRFFVFSFSPFFDDDDNDNDDDDDDDFGKYVFKGVGNGGVELENFDNDDDDVDGADDADEDDDDDIDADEEVDVTHAVDSQGMPSVAPSLKVQFLPPFTACLRMTNVRHEMPMLPHGPSQLLHMVHAPSHSPVHPKALQDFSSIVRCSGSQLPPVEFGTLMT